MDYELRENWFKGHLWFSESQQRMRIAINGFVNMAVLDDGRLVEYTLMDKGPGEEALREKGYLPDDAVYLGHGESCDEIVKVPKTETPREVSIDQGEDVVLYDMDDKMLAALKAMADKEQGYFH